MLPPKPIEFLGSSRRVLVAFPDEARRTVGFQLDRVQRGMDPHDWKPLPTIGPGAMELRVNDSTGAFRVVYVARFVEAIYVLHAFQKKSPKGIRTAQSDVDLVERRLKVARQDYEARHGKTK